MESRFNLKSITILGITSLKQMIVVHYIYEQESCGQGA